MTPQPRCSSSDQGFSLVEVLISVVIAAIAFAALLGGLGTTVLASDVHRQQADAHAVLVSAAEALDDPLRNPYKPCAQPSGVDSYNPTAGVTLPALAGGGTWPSSAVTVERIEHGNWGGTSFSPVATCTTSAPPPLQRITVTVRAPGERAVDRITMIKRATR